MTIEMTVESKDQESSLLKLFNTFEEQCKRLEHSHDQLKQQLNQANLELEHKNAELADKISELEQMKERITGIFSSMTESILLIRNTNEICSSNDICI